MAKKLADVIWSIEFSDMEKRRIVDSLRSISGVPYDMLTEYAPQIKDTDFWRRAQKKFKITGFRDGHPSAKPKVIRRVLDIVKGSEVGEEVDIWPLYKFSVYTCLKTDLTELDRLLKVEEFQESNGSLTEQIFRSIKIKVPLYQLGEDDLVKLYNFWGFERSENIDAILNDNNLDIAVVRKLISIESQEIKKQLSDEINSSKQVMLNNLQKSEDRIEKILESVENFDEKINSSVAILRLEFQNLAASLLNKKVNELQQSLKEALQKTTDVSKPTADAEALMVLESRIDKLSKQMHILDERISMDPAAKKKLPVTGNAFQKGSAPTIAEISSQWRQRCKGMGISDISLQAIPIILQMIARSKILITPYPQVLMELYRLSGVVTHSASVSPLWTKSDELSAQAEFLNNPEITSKVLFLFDFDSAIQEAYLIPFLTDWLQSSFSEQSKIILVPASASLNQVSPKVLEVAWHLNWSEDHWKEVGINFNEIDERFSKLEFAALHASDLCKFKYSTNIGFQNDLSKISMNEGILLPPKLMDQFTNIQIGLTEVLSHAESGNAAVSLCVIPWLKSSRGEAVSRIFEERFKMVFGG